MSGVNASFDDTSVLHEAQLQTVVTSTIRGKASWIEFTLGKFKKHKWDIRAETVDCSLMHNPYCTLVDLNLQLAMYSDFYEH